MYSFDIQRQPANVEETKSMKVLIHSVSLLFFFKGFTGIYQSRNYFSNDCFSHSIPSILCFVIFIHHFCRGHTHLVEVVRNYTFVSQGSLISMHNLYSLLISDETIFDRFPIPSLDSNVLFFIPSKSEPLFEMSLFNRALRRFLKLCTNDEI